MPLSGSYRVSYSMLSYVNSDQTNIVHLHHNDLALEESRHKTHSSSGLVASTGGRELIVEASAGDSISLRTSTMDGEYWRVMTCFEFLPRIVNTGNWEASSRLVSTEFLLHPVLFILMNNRHWQNFEYLMLCHCQLIFRPCVALVRTNKPKCQFYLNQPFFTG